MRNDSDLMIAAAAAAAVVTWLAVRSRKRDRKHSRGTGGAPDWRALLREARADVAHAWRETPCWLFITGIRQAFFHRSHCGRPIDKDRQRHA